MITTRFKNGLCTRFAIAIPIRLTEKNHNRIRNRIDVINLRCEWILRFMSAVLMPCEYCIFQFRPAYALVVLYALMFQVDYQDARRLEESTIGTNISIPLAVLSLTLPGSSFLYYGQELGMRNGADGGNDPAGRDPYRAPIQWNTELEAGFTNGTASPYIPVNTDSPTRNVEVRHPGFFKLRKGWHRILKIKIVKIRRQFCFIVHSQCTHQGCTGKVNGEGSIKGRGLHLLVNS